MSARIVRATDVIDGDTIYLAATGGWTRNPAEAARAHSTAEAAALLAAAEMQPDEAMAPELALLPAATPRRRVPAEAHRPEASARPSMLDGARPLAGLAG